MSSVMPQQEWRSRIKVLFGENANARVEKVLLFYNDVINYPVPGPHPAYFGVNFLNESTNEIKYSLKEGLITQELN